MVQKNWFVPWDTPENGIIKESKPPLPLEILNKGSQKGNFNKKGALYFKDQKYI